MPDSEARMTRTAMLAAALLATVATPLVAQADPVASAADAALTQDRYAWDFVEGVTPEVGPRQAGTEAEKRGRDWAVAWLKRNGFVNVADEPFEMDTWVPGDTHKAEILSPYAQPLVIQPLGNSASTGPISPLCAMGSHRSAPPSTIDTR